MALGASIATFFDNSLRKIGRPFFYIAAFNLVLATSLASYLMVVLFSPVAHYTSFMVAVLVIAVAGILACIGVGLAVIANTRRRISEKQAEIEIRHTTMLSAIGDFGILMLDPNGVILSWNPGAVHVFGGWTSEEMVGKPHEVFFTEEDRDSGLPARILAEVAKNGRSKFEATRVKNGGVPFVASVSISPMYCEQGSLVGFVKVISDITKRKRNENDLLYQLQLTKTITDTAADPLFQIDEAGKVSFMNPAASRVFGYEPSELLGKVLHDVMHWKLPNGTLTPECDCPIVRGIKERRTLSDHEDHFIHKDGHSIPVVMSMSPIVRDNNACGAVLTVHDATERKRSIKVVADSERFARATVDALSANIAILDETGRIIEVNKAWRDFTSCGAKLGVDATNAIGVNYLSVCLNAIGHDAQYGYAAGQGIQSVLKGEQTLFEMEYPCHSPTRHNWYVMRVTRFAGDGPVRAVVAHENITEIKMTEAALRAAKEAAEGTIKAKDHFIAILSHELRTPLTPVLATLDGMRRFNRVPHNLAADVAMMQRNIELEISLVDDLLDVTRASRGKLHLNLVDIHLPSLIETVVSSYGGEAKRKRIAVEMDFRATSNYVRGDRARLQQVFLNLLKNSIKFTNTDGKIIFRTTDENEKIRTQVIDNGKGIPSDVLPKLFSPFEQGEVKPGSAQQQGLGLGLSICKSLIELHGGKIEAASDGRYRGTTISITLLAVEAEIPSEKPANTSFVPVEKANRGRVLFVEDHDDSRDMLGRLLTWAGFEVTTADSVEMGYAVFADKYPNIEVLVSDIGLPDGTGYELIERLIGKYGKSNVVAVALSGFGLEEDKEKCRNAGFLKHVTKPIDIEGLSDVIDELVAIKRKEEANHA